MTAATVTAIVAAVLAAIAAAVSWRIRAADRRAKRAEVERDTATDRAERAEATASAAAESAADKAAGVVLSGEINAPTSGTPADRIRTIDDRVREIARREGASGGDSAAMRGRPPTDPASGTADE